MVPVEKAGNRKPSIGVRLRRDKHYLLMLLIPFVLMAVFRIVPIIGNVIAFRKYRMGGPLLGVSWVGLQYFNMFISDPQFWRAFINSLTLSLLNLAVNFPIPIVFALLVNEIGNSFFKRLTQTVSYLPRFLATVIVVGILREMLSPNGGLVNQMITALGGHSIYFMNDPAWYRTIFVGSDAWQFTGFYAIIYLAALPGIDPGLYEAAEMDGAGRFRKMWHITLPGIRTTVIYMLLLTIGYMLSIGYDKSVLLYTPANAPTSDIIETLVYRMGLMQNSYSYSAAVGLFSSVIAVVLLSSSNYLSKKFADTGFF